MAELVIIAETIILIVLFLLWLWQERKIKRMETELAALRQKLEAVQGALE